MYNGYDLGWDESIGAISTLNVSPNAMSAMSAVVSVPSPVWQLGDAVSSLNDAIGLTSGVDLVEECSSFSNFIDDLSVNTDLVGTHASTMEDNAAILDMSGLTSAATSVLEASPAFSDTENLGVKELQSVVNFEEDFSSKLEQVNEAEPLLDAITDISPIRDLVSGLATALDIFSNACQAISGSINQLVEAFDISIQSTFSHLGEYVEKLAEIFRQRCKNRTKELQNRFLWEIYRRLTFIIVGSPQKITMRNTLSHKKKFIFHRKQGGESDPDSFCCVKDIAVINQFKF